ncbi:MAG: hypothetical protein PHF60_01415 [Candidatus ainarchaeum sp.]|nr:hypothetical protein [Candidatus ainarchaeum sp.]
MKSDIMGIMDKRRWSHKKGQAVMEYLITYGLALFVILVVLAILVAVVLPSLKAPEMCSFSQGFTCNQKEHVLVADSANNVRLLFQLDNSQGKAVVVKGVLCTDETAANVQKANVPLLSSTVSLSSGQSHQFGGATDNLVPCTKADATNVVLTPGSNFKGTLAIVYSFSDEVEGAPDRLATATLSGTVQSE